MGCRELIYKVLGTSLTCQPREESPQESDCWESWGHVTTIWSPRGGRFHQAKDGAQTTLDWTWLQGAGVRGSSPREARGEGSATFAWGQLFG